MPKKKPVIDVEALRESPDAPVMLTADVQPDLTVKCSWAPPLHCDPPLRKYLLWLSPERGSAQIFDIVPEKTSATFQSGLTPNMVYTVGVWAQNVDGGSALSNLLAFKVTDIPQAPRLNSATSTVDGVLLKWGNVSTGTLTRLTALVRADGSDVVVKSSDLPTSGTQGYVFGLKAGRYSIALVAKYLTGTSGESNRVVVDWSPSPAPVPLDTPVISSVTAGDLSAVLTWTSTDARVVRQVVDVESPTRHFGTFEVPVGDRVFTVTGLTNKVEYRLSVTVFSDVDSAVSQMVRVTPKAAPLPPETPAWVSLTSNEVATAQASWATSAWASSYDVTFVNGGTQESRTVTGLTGTTFTARTLVKGATYVFTITARNEVGAAAGEPRSVVVKDDSPAPLPKPTVQVTPLVGGKADMSWTVASDARLTGWLLTILNSDGSAFSENAYPAAQRAQQVIGLTEGSTYTATITARYGTALMSSDAAPFTEPLTPDTAPNPPTITKAEQTLPGEVVVIWAPSPVGGAAKTFNVTVTDTETGKVFYTKTGLTFTTLFVTGEFRNGVAYTFAVTAVNGKGESGPATRDVTVIVTPPAPAIKTVVNNPDQPGMVDITFDSRGTPSVYGVTGWNVQHQVDGAPTWTDTVFPFPIVGVLSIGDLATGKKHNFRMKAIGSKESALSNTVSITVVDGFPAALKFLQADFKGTTEAWLYWGQNATLGKVEGYELVVTDKTTGDEHGSKAYPANQSDTIYTGKFTSGHVYTFAMRQTNRFGDGPASTLDKAFGTAPAPVVTSIQAIQGMSGAADIDFAYPASTMTDWGYTKFAVEWSLDGQDQWTRVILDSYTRRYQARGLQGGKEYKFHLMAMDGTGASKSDWSALSTVTTYGTAPAITESSTPAKGTLDFTMTGDYGADEVIVSVADKGGDQLSYHAKRIGDHGWEINGGRWRAGDCIVSASPVIGGGTKDWSDPITITLK